MHDNLSKDQQKKIKEFVVAALEYNKTHNIFSRESEEEVYKKDVLDCIPLVKKIKNQNFKMFAPRVVMAVINSQLLRIDLSLGYEHLVLRHEKLHPSKEDLRQPLLCHRSLANQSWYLDWPRRYA